ncbi:hypothetical protein MJ1_0158 [Nanobdella aerobiophila]|uniref:Uncharacterized protein n=1 Tax=Nanobdella aerobiophila TaxID=2586965 RepID=A0A915SI02_9ARCH|nr:hypothetical protein [Nanobdella aerobiophila]BBL45332.1 hypothetical protein MJ1_0158 [Nanobdella aerobiophila]
MNISKNIQESFNLYKNNIMTSIALGFLLFLINLLNSIPIIGTFIYSYLYPRILKYYYEKLTKEKLDSKLNISFISIFIPNLLIGIEVIFSLLFIIFKNYVFLYIAFLLIVAGIILYVLSLYTIFGSILGKVDKYKFYIKNSFSIFVNLLVIGIILFSIYILIAILSYFISLLLAIILDIGFSILILLPLLNVVLITSTKNL